MLKYEIYDGKVCIIGVTDKSIKSIVIPDIIDGYPVTIISSFETYRVEELFFPNSVNHINHNLLRNHGNQLKSINNQPIIDGFCVINNRFIYNSSKIYKIVYIIGDDYCLEYLMLSYHFNNYRINGVLYYENFNK